jgi:hypothetical protein
MVIAATATTPAISGRDGTKTTDEMCHNFVIAYPAGALTSQGFLENSCIGLP